MPDPAPIPVHLIVGPLGAGKTTAIARLLADKPRDEAWLVVLNEFTDTGLDAITLAASATGAYDLRLIPGGCLCCTGEADFRQQMSALLSDDPAKWPARILIEPSGIGHPGGVIEELRLFERGGALALCSTIALLDAQRMSAAALSDETLQAQLAAADVLLLSKADLASEAERQQFMQWARSLYPPKRYIGLSMQGVLPLAALHPPTAGFEFELRERTGLHTAHEHEPRIARRQEQWHGVSVVMAEQELLGRNACGWIMGSGLQFDLPRLRAWLTDAHLWRGVERFKAVLRTGVDEWHLLQRWPDQWAIQSCPWRQDSRIEVQLEPGAPADWPKWTPLLCGMSERCPVA